MLRSFDDVFSLWPSISELARDLGLRRESHGTLMKARGSIPPAHWPRLIEAAERRGIPGISYETLARLASERRAERSCVLLHSAPPGRDPANFAGAERASAPALSGEGA